MEKQKDDEQLLELIPKLSAKQKAFRPNKRKDTMPMYKLLREPTHFDDMDWKKYRNIAIWRDNHTLICVGPSARRQNGERRVFFTIHQEEGQYTLECAIYGKKDSAIAATAAFFWSLQHLGESRLEIYACEKRNKNDFSFAALSAEQLARILDANPSRHWEFQTGFWSAEQCLIFATRPYPLKLKLTESLGAKSCFRFKDEGNAFVDALETRQSSFGSLCIDFDLDEMPFSPINLLRIFRLETIDKLSCSILEWRLVLEPFRAQVNTLDYEINVSHIETRDVDSLDIATTDLNLRFYLENAGDWSEGRIISFLNRVAVLGHLERFGFSMDCGGRYIFALSLERIVEALVRAIITNTKLTYLNLGDSHSRFEWVPHLQIIFKAIEEHKSLRTVVMNDRYWVDDSYSLLEHLLSRNRDIVVLNPSGKKISNGPAIDNAYLLSQIYYGSVKLLKESTQLRPGLVETALVRGASTKFPHTALLLYNHADILCESLLLVEEDVSQPPSEDAPSPASSSPRSRLRTNSLKRKMVVEHQSNAVKKTTRK